MKKIRDYIMTFYYIVMICVYEARAEREARRRKGSDRWEF